MEKSIETQASSVDLAVEKALVELGVSKDKVDVEVVSKGGLFSKAKVRVTVKDSVADKMAEFFNGTLSRMGLVSRATVEDKNGTLYITISGDDSGVAIGYRGEALDAFQYLALTFLNEQKCDFKKWLSIAKTTVKSAEKRSPHSLSNLLKRHFVCKERLPLNP